VHDHPLWQRSTGIEFTDVLVLITDLIILNTKYFRKCRTFAE